MAITPDEVPLSSDVTLGASTLDPLGALPLQVFVSHAQDRAHVVLAGELDASTARFLRQKLVDVTAELDGDLVLDIGLLTFLDSSGLSLFVSQHKKMRARGASLVIFAPTPMALRVFEITGLNQVLSIESGGQGEDDLLPLGQ